jgi:hypothetical protein
MNALPSTQFDNTFVYSGISMVGTFRPGDSLRVEAVTLADICPGDLVVYNKADSLNPENKVVHRVAKVIVGGIVTHGDFIPRGDVDVVLEENIVGRVVQFERNGKLHRVRGGRWGVWRGWWLRRWNPVRIQVKRWLLRHITPAGRPFYRWLRNSGLVPHLWHPAIVKVRIETENGPMIKFVVNGKRIVAYWWPEDDRFSCRKPYDLIIPRPKP